MNTTLKDFTIPENRNQITAISYTTYDNLVTPKEVEACLVACPNITNLKIRTSSGIIDMSAAPNKQLGEVIAKIAVHGMNIESLSIISGDLRDEHLMCISQKTLPALRRLSLPRCGRIGALGKKNVATQCPELTHLDVHYSLFDEANESAFLIGQYLPKLKFLSMHRSCNVLDSGLGAIAEGCPQLERLSMGRNYQLTDESLKKLGQYCPELTTLDMYHNSKITEKGIQYLVDGCPKFKQFNDGGGWGAIKGLKDVKHKFPSVTFG